VAAREAGGRTAGVDFLRFAGRVPQNETEGGANFFSKLILFNHLDWFTPDHPVDCGEGVGVCVPFIFAKANRSGFSRPGKLVFCLIMIMAQTGIILCKLSGRNFKDLLPLISAAAGRPVRLLL
jgi:hypothetical protein